MDGDVKRTREGDIAETSLELNPEEISIESVLGDGPLGTVYRGQVRQNTVSIRVLKSGVLEEETAIEAFKKEVETLSYIRHPNLCLFMGYTLKGPKIMIVNELLKSDLETCLSDKDMAMTMVDRIRIAKDAALGLSWLHRNKISHKNLKPSNILIDSNSKAKIADYGLGAVRLLTQSYFAKRGEINAVDTLPYWTAPELLAFQQQIAANSSGSPPSSLISALNTLSMSGETASPSSASEQVPTNSLRSSQSGSQRISLEKCDIYSFGIILWQLLTKREPYSFAPEHPSAISPASAAASLYLQNSTNTPETPLFSLPYIFPFTSVETFIKTVVVDKQRPLIPSDTLTSLTELITDCCDANPNRRPPFQSIVKRLDHVLVDYAVRDPLANKFWKDSFPSSGGEHVKWKEFCNQFGQFIGLTVPGSLNILDLIAINHHKVKDTPIPQNIRCLHAILCPIQVPSPQDTSTEEMVSLDTFGKMMEWFGPIRKDAKASILSRISNVLKQPWFHGDIPTNEAEMKLMALPVGTFLVRFSNSSPGIFAISRVVAELKVQHMRVNRTAGPQGIQFSLGTRKADTLECLIELVKDEYKLLFAATSPPYAFLFHEQVPIGSYAEQGAPKGDSTDFSSTTT